MKSPWIRPAAFVAIADILGHVAFSAAHNLRAR